MSNIELLCFFLSLNEFCFPLIGNLKRFWWNGEIDTIIKFYGVAGLVQGISRSMMYLVITFIGPMIELGELQDRFFSTKCPCLRMLKYFLIALLLVQ